jgi:hypothetical protein
MYNESTLVQVVQKVVVHKQFFRQSHCFKYIVRYPIRKYYLVLGQPFKRQKKCQQSFFHLRGPPIWTPNMDPNMDPQYGPPLWTPIMDPHYGPPLWTPIMDPHYGPPLWTPIMNPHYGPPAK